MINLQDKFCGALVGTHTGDALGMPVEGLGPKAIELHLGEVREMEEARLGAGTYTDDTEMMIGMAESLIRCRGFNGEDMARAFIENFHAERGYGGGTRKALSLLRSGVPWDKAGLMVFKGGSFGNGSAMRIAPVGCLYYDNPSMIKEVSYKSSAITHAHPLGKEGAALQAFAIALAVALDPAKNLNKEKFLNELESFIDSTSMEYHNKLKIIRQFLEKEPAVEEVIKALGHDVRATHSVPTAIYSFLAHVESFEEAVVYAVGLGGDTDTIGAMTGAISGAYHGQAGIPVRWLSKLENQGKGKDYIINLAIGLYRLKESTGNEY